MSQEGRNKSERERARGGSGVKDGGVVIGMGRRREKVSLVLFSFHYED